jgi:hypothetical protein
LENRGVAFDNLERLGFYKEIRIHDGKQFVNVRQPNGEMIEREMTPEEIEWYNDNTIEKKFERLSNLVERIICEKKVDHYDSMACPVQEPPIRQIMPAVKMYCKYPGCTHSNVEGWQLYTCDRCGKPFCHTHRLCDDHKCPSNH